MVTSSLLVLVGWTISGIVGAVVGNMKGRPVLGVILGLLLPLVGCVFLLLITDDVRPKCPDCGNPIEKSDGSCLYCNSVSSGGQSTHQNEASLSGTTKAVWATIGLATFLFLLAAVISLRGDEPNGDLIGFLIANSVWCLPVAILLTLFFGAKRYERWTERQYDRLKSRSASNSQSSEKLVTENPKPTELPRGSNFVSPDPTPPEDE